jgi:hypothetical protein
MRLLAQLPHADRDKAIFEAAESGCEIQSLALDRAATIAGQTLEAWAYSGVIGASGTSLGDAQ